MTGSPHTKMPGGTQGRAPHSSHHHPVSMQPWRSLRSPRCQCYFSEVPTQLIVCPRGTQNHTHTPVCPHGPEHTPSTLVCPHGPEPTPSALVCPRGPEPMPSTLGCPHGPEPTPSALGCPRGPERMPSTTTHSRRLSKALAPSPPRQCQEAGRCSMLFSSPPHVRRSPCAPRLPSSVTPAPLSHCTPFRLFSVPQASHPQCPSVQPPSLQSPLLTWKHAGP